MRGHWVLQSRCSQDGGASRVLSSRHRNAARAAIKGGQTRTAGNQQVMTSRFQTGDQGSDAIARHASASADGMPREQDNDGPEDRDEDALAVQPGDVRDVEQ